MYETETVSNEPRTIEPESAPKVECLEFYEGAQPKEQSLLRRLWDRARGIYSF